MKQWLKDLFSDSSTVSAMRVMAMISLFMGCYLAIQGRDTSVAIFVGAAFTGKCVQKYTELNSK